MDWGIETACGRQRREECVVNRKEEHSARQDRTMFSGRQEANDAVHLKTA